MKNRNSEKLSWLSRGPLIKFFLAAIFPIALSTSSCCATKRITQSDHREIRDSVVIREVREVIPVRIPESKAELSIQTESLRNLPDGASFTKKQGQASVEVVYVNVPGEPEHIIVTATCDSLLMLTTNLQRDLTRIREQTRIEKTQIKTDNFRNGFKWGVVSTCLAGILIALAWSIIKRKIKFLNELQ